MMEGKCKKCGAVLLQKVKLPNSEKLAIDKNTPVRLERDETNLYFRCESCKYKNIVMSDGNNSLKIFKIEK
ncbi:MAG: hypothetical protein HYV34_03120 [Candidatus Kerfeldbacteria bacterium]|nr:hypothetical protein [Candidatus Kerfeldbacteria bacterium]